MTHPRQLFAFVFVVALMGGIASSMAGQDTDDADALFTSATFNGLKFRSVGPALTSGRVSDIAVHPDHRKIYYAATAVDFVISTM